MSSAIRVYIGTGLICAIMAFFVWMALKPSKPENISPARVRELIEDNQRAFEQINPRYAECRYETGREYKNCLQRVYNR